MEKLEKGKRRNTKPAGEFCLHPLISTPAFLMVPHVTVARQAGHFQEPKTESCEEEKEVQHTAR